MNQKESNDQIGRLMDVHRSARFEMARRVREYKTARAIFLSKAAREVLEEVAMRMELDKWD